MEEYAVAFRPLVVTRTELVKILNRMPPDVLLGPATSSNNSSTNAMHRELLEVLGGAIAVVAKVPGSQEVPGKAKVLCLGLSFDYGTEEYALSSRCRTRLLLSCWVLGTSDAACPDAAEQGAAPLSQEPKLQLKIADVASREPFIAELLAMEGALAVGMADEKRAGLDALKKRRRALRRVADTLRDLRASRKEDARTAERAARVAEVLK
eukprot:TRINITY_DN32496_c0_g1_i2.p2 TRINITY_DN32496_c0_g1~~TRINITY_DN32496_c0_g1_i2.p2  ORF type:complete len:209 (+),score=48.48 TRINITY_DN32496_c0_g1_i2:272-898(+)